MTNTPTATTPLLDVEALPPLSGSAPPPRKSILFLSLLTVGIGGLQIAWSVELSNGSPYLLRLGLSKALMALVWIAGPLSGTLVQPYVGLCSDRCRWPGGRRTPFLVGGTVATVVSLLGLAWAGEYVGWVLSLFGLGGSKTTTIVVAVVWVYILDFAINTVQAALRAFIVDCAPRHQQEAANAMASRMTGFGNIAGYVAGYLDLPRYLWFLGHSQFQILCSLACIALVATIALSCSLIHEPDPSVLPPPSLPAPSLWAFFGQMPAAVRRLPKPIRMVCLVQFCAWVGFFPMLFYTSSYVGEIYVEPFLRAHYPDPWLPADLDRLYEDATRVGTFALLIYAITSLCTNVFLPFFVAPTYDGRHQTSFLTIRWLTLRRAWLLSLLLFAVCMACTVLVRSVVVATVLVGLVGITWALTLWAPYAIISAEIRRVEHASSTTTSADGSDIHPEAGIILGIHNMAIAAPQILATVGSSVVFHFLQKPRGAPGDHSIAVVMALGGLPTLLAAYFVHKMEDVGDDDEEEDDRVQGELVREGVMEY